MLIANRYFILSITNDKLAQIYGPIIGDETIQSYSNDRTKVTVRLPAADMSNHSVLKNAVEYDYDGILIEMAKPEWVPEM